MASQYKASGQQNQLGVTATIGAISRIRSTLVALGKLQQLGLLGLKRTVSFSGSAVAGIRAAIPVGNWAAAIMARGLSFRVTLAALGQLHQQGLLGL